MPKKKASAKKQKSVETKEFKVESDFGRLTILATNNCVGVWLQENGSPDKNSLGLVLMKDQPPHIQLYPPKEFGSSLPFAFGGNGLQIPLPNSKQVIFLSLEEIAKLAKKLSGKSPTDIADQLS